MVQTLFVMFFLIGFGLYWAYQSPGRLEPVLIRKVLTDTVYYLFLPALVFNVLWQADLNLDSVKIASGAAIGVLTAIGLSLLICKRCGKSSAVTGAIVLASSFPNATYLGYPLLISALGEPGGAIAIQYDLFACTPLLLTVGILLAARLGQTDEKINPLKTLLWVPPLWAAIIATGFNLAGVEPGGFPLQLSQTMGAVVVPIMLFAIGLALKQGFSELQHLSSVIPVVIIQLVLMPALVYAVALVLELEGVNRTGTVLEAAMPSMVLGVVLCDRFKLNSGIYATAVTTTTLLSVITLPLWYAFLVNPAA